jgi:hypothetical protein
MRPAAFATLCCLLACEAPNTRIDTVTVQWMDWPAEVNAGQPFRTRLVVSNVCALNPRFRAGARADQSAVTFEPYFVVDDHPIACVATSTILLVTAGALDTAGMAPALGALAARTYEMRAAMPFFALSANQNPLVGTFGTVVVRPSGADQSRRNAAGYASFWRDSLGCARLRPAGLYSPGAALVLENQADTSSLARGFVEGYIHAAPAPVCGETQVFYLLTRVAY